MLGIIIALLVFIISAIIVRNVVFGVPLDNIEGIVCLIPVVNTMIIVYLFANWVWRKYLGW